MKSAARCAWLAAVKIARLSALSTPSQVGDVRGVFLTRLKRQIKVGTQGRSTEFRHEFFDWVAFGPECVVPKSRAKRDSCAVHCVVS
jgi:hypothetical protein